MSEGGQGWSAGVLEAARQAQMRRTSSLCIQGEGQCKLKVHAYARTNEGILRRLSEGLDEPSLCETKRQHCGS